MIGSPFVHCAIRRPDSRGESELSRIIARFRDRQLLFAGNCQPRLHRFLNFGEGLGRAIAKR